MVPQIAEHTDAPYRRALVQLYVAAVDDAIRAFRYRLHGPSGRHSIGERQDAVELLKSLLHWADDRGVFLDQLFDQACEQFTQELER